MAGPPGPAWIPGKWPAHICYWDADASCSIISTLCGLASTHNGDIPFAIFTGDTKPQGSYLNGLRHPEDVVTYRPPVREGLPATARETRQWIGLFRHWEPQAEPLSTLGATCFILTAAEIVDHTGDRDWLAERLSSIEAAGSYLLSRKSPNGLIARSGFYMELPPLTVGMAWRSATSSTRSGNWRGCALSPPARARPSTGV